MDSSRRKNSFGEDSSSSPTRGFILPPIRSERDAGSLHASINHSPGELRRYSRDQRYNVFSKGSDIKFSRAPRFKEDKPASNEPFIYKKPSDFDPQTNKGPHIGYGAKLDFTKDNSKLPGVGRYHIPSLWDKYV